MSYIKPYKPSILCLGYDAGAVLSVLQPYINRKQLKLIDAETTSINRMQSFLESALRGCEINKNPRLLFAPGELYFKAPADLGVVLKIFITRYQNLPQDQSQLENELKNYINILEKLKKWDPLETLEVKLAENTFYFFEKLAEMSDMENYKSTFGSPNIADI